MALPPLTAPLSFGSSNWSIGRFAGAGRCPSFRRMLVFDHVSKSYGSTPALHEVTVTVQPGTVVGLVGHNGAGKSTLMRTAVGLVRPDGGRVTLGGEPVERLGRLGGLVAASFDASTLPANWSAMTAVRVTAGLAGVPEARVAAVLEMVGLAGVAGKRIGRPVRAGTAGTRRGTAPALGRLPDDHRGRPDDHRGRNDPMSSPSTLQDHRRPVPFGRLILAHARIWRAQRGVVAGCLLALAAGLLSVAGSMATLSGTVTAAVVSTRFSGLPIVAFSLLWPAVGAIAGAAPVKSGWAAVLLTVAPRRGRWLAACLVSFLLLAAAVTALFTALAVVVTVAVLAAKGQHPAMAVGIGRPVVATLVLVVIQAGIGFLLGAATRSVTASIIIGYVVAPALPMATIGSVDLGRWLDLDGALTALSSGSGHALPPALTAALLWVAVPALVAWSRLRTSVA
jgi:ABC-2 type transport system ATP-binding protein